MLAKTTRLWRYKLIQVSVESFSTTMQNLSVAQALTTSDSISLPRLKCQGRYLF